MGTQNTGFELMLFLGDGKSHRGTPVRAGAYGRQGNQWSFTSDPLQMHLVGPQIHPVVISPTPENIISIDILSDWQNPHDLL